MRREIELAFHAERLDDVRVWRRVERVAQWMAQHSTGATFFVYPFRAQAAAKNITDQVGALSQDSCPLDSERP